MVEPAPMIGNLTVLAFSATYIPSRDATTAAGECDGANLCVHRIFPVDS